MGRSFKGEVQLQAKDYPLHVVLSERQQWVIPVYQRTYAWDWRTDKQIPRMWDDLRDRALERLDGEKPKPHFVGAIIYSQPAEQPFGTVNRRFLVDGQQRITTFSLVLCALRECAREAGVDRLVGTIDEYLFNARSASMAEPEREQFKLWSSSFDRPVYVAIAQETAAEVAAAFPEFFYQNGNLIWGQAPRVLAAYWFMRERMNGFVEEGQKEGISAERSLDAVLSGFLSGFQIVVVQLGQEDDAQAIFASLNGNAEPLTAFDLIRNDIFHRARKAMEDDDALYDQHWRELETSFWKTEVKQGRLKRPRTDHLVTHAVVAETARDVVVGQVANEYRHFAEAREFASVADEVRALLEYARAYERMERRTEDDGLSRLAAFLDVWDTSTLHPVALWTATRNMPETVRNRIFTDLEAYVVRRDICDLGNKNYNKVVVGLLQELHRAADPYSAFVSHLTGLTGEASRMPTDADVAAAAARKPLYTQLGSRKLRYLLSRTERALRGRFDENVSIETDNLTVEHLLPDRWAEHWTLPSGERVGAESYYALLSSGVSVGEGVRREMETREGAKHTLGNLTLLTSSLNPSIGNGPWNEKRVRIRGSLLALNRNVAEHEEWNETTIDARGATLAVTINGLWTVPSAAASEVIA